MTIERFEEIQAWQHAKQLAIEVHVAFKEVRDYGFRDQLERAVVSVMNNIAEGYERKGDKEFSHFLFIAKGSSGEVRSMLYLAKELGYLSQEQFTHLHTLATETSKLISGFIKHLNST